MIKVKNPARKSFPLGMVGSTKFGFYPIISSEQTYNMFITDNFLVPYPGYKNVATISNSGISRGGFVSSRADVLFIVAGDMLYIVSSGLVVTAVGTLNSTTGPVYLEENNANQILISDNNDLYVYNYQTNAFSVVTFNGANPPFKPGYITFQDGYFISPDISSPFGPAQWRLSALNNGLLWPTVNTGTLTTKATTPQACIRFPSMGNQLLVMGETVTEPWYDVGAFPFPYTRSNSYNIDYGTVSPPTIAEGDKFIMWIGSNEKSQPVLMVSTGGGYERISNDGIDFVLSQIQHPEESYGFLFKTGGHLFYQFSFTNPADNVSYAYDLNTQRFYTVTDENMNVHIAQQSYFFNHTNYFISIRDGNLYQFDTQISDYDYGGGYIFEIPRIRVTPTWRAQDTSTVVEDEVSFILEQGVNTNPARIDLSISYDGGYTYSGDYSYDLNNTGNYRNKVQFWKLGYTNSVTHQFRFHGLDRFVVGEGVMEMTQ